MHVEGEVKEHLEGFFSSCAMFPVPLAGKGSIW